ncbi:SDR family NAD(P)-dependent oxidoreductase [Roseovarius aestuarii]|nr:SDR family NAD(P)-dependent oxidoreductase [Roseovarius aestuarii]
MTTSLKRFAGKVAIVSGGADGMGAACVRQLASEQARVFVLDVKHEMATALAQELSDNGADVTALKADVMDESELRTAIANAIELGGGVDTLINVAGGSASGLVSEIDLGVWDRLYKLNLRSTLTACQCVIPAMRDGGGGSIVTMSSISGLRGDPDWAAYNAMKAAILNMTQSLAWEEGQYGIRVNAICPGPVASERMLATISDAHVAEYAHAIALGRLGKAEELAQAILFLASDQASFVTGTSLVADGGLTASTAQPTSWAKLPRKPAKPI